LGRISACTGPDASVSGAGPVAAIVLLEDFEPVPRGPYCGALGWVDADRGTASLNVAIRTFWFAEGELHFGTGGGITWGSDPAGEWDETVLKAANLLSVVSSPTR
jgi:para-aminobenzoate synthetase component 1